MPKNRISLLSKYLTSVAGQVPETQLPIYQDTNLYNNNLHWVMLPSRGINSVKGGRYTDNIPLLPPSALICNYLQTHKIVGQDHITIQKVKIKAIPVTARGGL
jgi:hypothetical protein